VGLKGSEMRIRWIAAAVAVVLSASCGQGVDKNKSLAAPRAVDAKSLLAAAGNTEDWLTYGRTYDEQRFSPLESTLAM
jgi:quinohemoprotein ethanol dehydrogenase